MSQDATVNAGDIARLVDVGRAAVSNWRRRHGDFPQPVGGTASSPLFSLREVEEWLRHNGKAFRVSLADRTWQRLRATGDDLRLGARVASAGALLLDLLGPTGGREGGGECGRDDGGEGGRVGGREGGRVGGGDGGREGGRAGGREGGRADGGDGGREGGRAGGRADGGDGGREGGRNRERADGRGGGRQGGRAGGRGLVDLLPSVPESLADPELVSLVTELAGERGHVGAFEFLRARYLDAHSRRLSTTPPEIAALMIDLVGPFASVLDPACGLGTLLLAAPGGTSLFGQELHDTSAVITATRLLLARAGTDPAAIDPGGGPDVTVLAGDSLRSDGFTDMLVDAVVCDPPFNERAWGYAELTSDPRWEYGLPPRGESELAWVQHCLAHTRPGGLAAILMPPAAAARRPGKRIRGNLLRAGALRAVVSLAPNGPDLWLLRRPEPGDRPPSHLLLMSAHDDLSSVTSAWRRHIAAPDGGDTARIIDLLDDDVDLSPARHRSADAGEHLVRDLLAAADRLRGIGLTPPTFDVPAERQALPMTTVGELVRAGLLTVTHAQARMATDDGDVPVLTADDLAAGRPPTGWTTDDPGLVPVLAGDVVVSVLGAARVLTTEEDERPAARNVVLGPYLTRYRVHPDRLDPYFLAGLLRSAEPAARTGSSRLDVRRVQVPRLPVAEQRRYGAAFRRLVALEDALRTATAAGGTLVRLGFDGLATGLLRPAE